MAWEVDSCRDARAGSFVVLMTRDRSRSGVPNIDRLHSLFIEAMCFDLDGGEVKSECFAENLVGLLEDCRSILLVRFPKAQMRRENVSIGG